MYFYQWLLNSSQLFFFLQFYRYSKKNEFRREIWELNYWFVAVNLKDRLRSWERNRKDWTDYTINYIKKKKKQQIRRVVKPAEWVLINLKTETKITNVDPVLLTSSSSAGARNVVPSSQIILNSSRLEYVFSLKRFTPYFPPSWERYELDCFFFLFIFFICFISKLGHRVPNFCPSLPQSR